MDPSRGEKYGEGEGGNCVALILLLPLLDEHADF
jgi:hypothetical protein